ncbi:MAG: hypothetical protein IPP77_02795 [Bacteroidetes bacterium]|nr:hypothetical protein [Bacteroidota bacterium]
MKLFYLTFIGVLLLFSSGCKKLVCEWPLQPSADPDRCVEVRYDITGVYRGYNFRSDGLSKPYDEYAIWAYHDDPKIITIMPGTIECLLTGKYTFFVFEQTLGGPPKYLDIKEGTGFVKDTFMEMKYVTTIHGDSTSLPTMFTFRGFRPPRN